jgi:hypothetical protein
MRPVRAIALGSVAAALLVMSAGAPAWADRHDGDRWHHHGWHGPGVVVAPAYPPAYYAPPPVYYAPPPVYYAPPPVYYAPPPPVYALPGIALGIRIR